MRPRRRSAARRGSRAAGSRPRPPRRCAARARAPRGAGASGRAPRAPRQKIAASPAWL